MEICNTAISTNDIQHPGGGVDMELGGFYAGGRAEKADQILTVVADGTIKDSLSSSAQQE